MSFSKTHKIGNFTYILHLKLEQNILKITVNEKIISFSNNFVFEGSENL